MAVSHRVVSSLAPRLAPRVVSAAPAISGAFVREALARAVEGVGPLPAAARAADAHLRDADGDHAKAVQEVIDTHVRYAGAQGFLTNLGGVVTAAVAMPANVTGLALVQCRMVAAIAHLRGHDVDDPRVRNAVTVCLLGEDGVDSLVRQHRIPAPPMALATAPAHDPDLQLRVSAEVAGALVARLTGKRLAVTLGRKIPLVGGVVGMGADGWSTWKVGDYAVAELLPRARR